MIRALRVQLALDAKQAWRHRFVHVVFGLATVFGLLVRFAVPARVERRLPWDDVPADLGAHHALTVLRPGAVEVPFDAGLVPLILGLDVALMGFLFGGVMVLQEKVAGTVAAYRTSPGGTAPYVLSKLGINLAMAAFNAAVFVAWAHPAGLLAPGVFAVTLVVVASLTLLGMGVAVFFDGLSSFFYPLALGGLLLNLPMIAYVSPSLSLGWMRWIPTWDVMFLGRELLFPTGRGADLGAVARLVGWLLVTGAFATWAVDRRLMREAAR
ncbi:MAG TPA: hypothetical protein RMH99_06980 [Sandaracinaceae bacterium LLY-WYZ-13_1]|nr:hypothetical protein [Sandaracinaceae bacterium LLY-WYZ-13_1]